MTRHVMISTGKQYRTADGHLTEPAPTIDCTTDRKATNSIKRMQEWLLDEIFRYADRLEPHEGQWIRTLFKNEQPGYPPATGDAILDVLQLTESDETDDRIE